MAFHRVAVLTQPVGLGKERQGRGPKLVRAQPPGRVQRRRGAADDRVGLEPQQVRPGQLDVQDGRRC